MDLRRATCIGMLAFAPLVLARAEEAPVDAVKGSTATPPARDAARAAASAGIDQTSPPQPVAAGASARALTQERLDEILAGAIEARRAIAQGARRRPGNDGPQALLPRQPLPKRPTATLAVPPDASGRLVVKFKDSWQVRCEPDGTLVSATGHELKEAMAIAREAGLAFSPAIKKDPARLSIIEARAAAVSRKAQPVLSSLVYLDGPGGVPVEVAAALNGLDKAGDASDPIEFVEYEPNYVVKGGPVASEGEGAPPQPVGGFGACCLGPPDFVCTEITSAECNKMGGTFWGGASCFLPPASNCCSGHAAPGCDDPACEALVCSFDPFCCAVQWDQICADEAAFSCPKTCAGVLSPCGACCVEAECTIDGVPPAICTDALGGIFLELAVCTDDEETDPCATTLGACCTPGGLCLTVVLAQCDALGGTFIGPGVECGGPLCGACCVEVGGDCTVTSPAACGGAFFVDQDCSTNHCVPACGAKIAGDCLVPHGLPFCDNNCFGAGCPTPPGFTTCCDAVCAIDPFCCDTDVTWPGRFPRWDPWCVDHALELCLFVFDGGGGAPQPPFADPSAPTPSFTDAQGYLSPLGYIQEFGFIPDNVAYALKYDSSGYPNLLDGYSGEGYDLQQLWEIGEFLANNLGTENYTRGWSINVAIIEHTAFVSTARGPDAPYQHEDLHGKVIPEPGQTPLILVDNQNDILDGHHGTATLGIVGAIDHDANGNPVPLGLSPDESRAEEVGMVGVAPEAGLYFFPTVSAEQGGRLLDAMASAIETFGPGDVLNFSIGPGGCGTLASDLGPWLLLRLASDLGITSCISAGNECCDLAANPQANGLDCGAIIVGACYPGADNVDFKFLFPEPWSTTAGFNQYCRLPFSNHCTACAEGVDRVHISSWGESVATLSGGDLFTGASNNDFNRSYTSAFGGTSAAAPLVAGVVACFQGLAKTFYGIPLMPEQIRGVISGTGWVQCGSQVPGDHQAIVQGIIGVACPDAAIDSYADWDRDELPNNVGVPPDPVAFTDLPAAAIEMIITGFFDGNGLLDGDVHILRGTHIFGNRFSILSLDGNFLIVESVYAQAGGGSNLDPLNPPLAATGRVTDIAVEAHVAPNLGATVDVAVVSQITNGTALAFVEAYNWVLKRYTLVGFGFLAPGDAYGGGGLAVEQYARASDGQVMIRVWTLSTGNQGGIGGSGNTYRVLHDLVILGVDGDFGGVIPPP